MVQADLHIEDGLVIAQVGCTHGSLDLVYRQIAYLEQRNNTKVDLAICCGDFQSLRNGYDMSLMDCPPKYKQMGDFIKYFRGEREASCLTVFIGGNHEASNYLRDLYYGGWVANNIYFMGASGVLTVTKGSKRVRIGGISGIDKHWDSQRGYFERKPYRSGGRKEQSLTKSMYHIREFEVQKFCLLQERVDVMVSHEWPTLVTTPRLNRDMRSVEQLIRFKPYFKDEIRKGILGSQMLS